MPQVNEMLSDVTIMPESLLREDDVGYEDIKNCVERGFGLQKHEKEHHGAQEPAFQSSDDLKYVFSLLDAMNMKGLYSLCMILTGGKVMFEKTKYRMRKIIKEELRKLIKTGTSKTVLELLSHLVNDPTKILESHLVVPTYHEVANKVLDELEDLCTVTLDVMHRKLLGKETIPSMWRKRQRRDYLISSIRENCKEMIAEVSEGGGPAEMLASALGIASLALKHLLNRQVAINFRNFSPEDEKLQNYIAESYRLLSKPRTGSGIELRRVEALLDPTPKSDSDSNSNSDSRIRTRLCNMLTEYLFECADMDGVPDSLMNALDVINNNPLSRSTNKRVCLSPQEVKDQMLKEVECVSRLSAQLKQVILDSFEKHEFDEDFTRAYMENYDESDFSEFSDDDDDWMMGNVPMHCKKIDNEAEGIGENMISEMDSLDLHIRNLFSAPPSAVDSSLKKGQTGEGSLEQTNTDSLQSGSSNAYLEMQDACDASSMVAYRFVGQKLLRLAGTELIQGDRLYLQSGAVPESSEGSEESLESLLTSKLTGMWKDLLE